LADDSAESDIDTALKDYNDGLVSFVEMVKEDDRVRTLKFKLKVKKPVNDLEEEKED
jgi:hypothetical protein